MKKASYIIITALLFLSGCSQEPIADNYEVSNSAVVINSGDKESYNIVAPMVQSPIRGIANDYASSNLDLENMEVGLMDISKQYASPTDNLYQAGQIISVEDANMLLDREQTDTQLEKKIKADEDYKNIGINPILEDKMTEEDAKVYATTIIEQDYYTLDSSGNKNINTISIGFGINPNYEYEIDGETKKIDISDSELIEFGYSYIANKMTDYLRTLEGYENVQIVYGFFIQSDSANVPGVYSAYTSVDSGNSTLNDIKTLDQEVVIYPSTSGSEKDKDLNTAFSNLETSIYEYFPTASGIFAYGYYSDNKLYDLEVHVMADIYSSVEIEPFVQYLISEINNQIAVDSPVSVEIARTNGEPLAIIYKDSGSNYTHHIY